MYYYKQLFTFERIDELCGQNMLIDGRKGGLLLGPSHEDGGIIFLFEFLEGFRVYGEIEGFEYVINKDSVKRYRGISDFNLNDSGRDFEYPFIEYEIDSTIMTIDARMPSDNNIYAAKFVILDVYGLTIINKHSTKKHLHLINAINKL